MEKSPASPGEDSISAVGLPQLKSRGYDMAFPEVAGRQRRRDGKICNSLAWLNFYF
jgi:hypothetical protein